MVAAEIVSLIGTTLPYRVHAADDDIIFASNGYSVVQIKGSADGNEICHFHIKVSLWRKIFVKFRLVARFFRLGIRNIFIIGDQILVIADKYLYCLNTKDGKFTYKTRFLFGVPINIAYNHIRGEYFYGSYETSRSKNEAIIFSSPDLVNWTKRYVFASTPVRHVHGVFVDPKADLMVVATGDTDEESKVLMSTDGCRTLDVLCEGNQYARVVSVVFDSDEHILVATDGPDIQNYVYRISLADRNSVVAPDESWVPIGGPCFELKKTDFGFFLSTVPEKSAINQTRYARVYYGEDIASIRHVISFERDLKFTEHFRPYLQHPNVKIVAHSIDGAVYISGTAVKNLDNKTLRLTTKSFVERGCEGAKIYR